MVMVISTLDVIVLVEELAVCLNAKRALLDKQIHLVGAVQANVAPVMIV